jgi:sugar-specific transcriptional regulator TrmB
LEQLGFSDVEARIYLKLLERGQMSVAELAKAVNINRTAAYSHVYSLLGKGVVAEVILGSRKLLVAIDPERLEHLILNKKNALNMIHNKFPDVLATINSSFAKIIKEDRSDIKYYKGRNGVKSIYDEALRSEELRSYFNIFEIEQVFPQNFHLFTEAFEKNKKIQMYEICEDSSRSREVTAMYSQITRYHYKILPKEVFLSSADTLIYDGKVSIINVSGAISGIVLNNIDYFNNSKHLFDLLWRLLPDSNYNIKVNGNK